MSRKNVQQANKPVNPTAASRAARSTAPGSAGRPAGYGRRSVSFGLHGIRRLSSYAFGRVRRVQLGWS